MTQELIHGIDALTAFALDAIRRSGQTALDYFGKGRGATKFDQGLVTRAELQISTCFQQALDNQYPDHRMFTSKTLDTTYTHGNRRYLWIFDPIDGVDNYQAGIPIWGMSLALLENFWPVFGAFSVPATGGLFPPALCFPVSRKDQKPGLHRCSPVLCGHGACGCGRHGQRILSGLGSRADDRGGGRRTAV
jgi:hypothetical protein